MLQNDESVAEARFGSNRCSSITCSLVRPPVPSSHVISTLSVDKSARTWNSGNVEGQNSFEAHKNQTLRSFVVAAASSNSSSKAHRGRLQQREPIDFCAPFT